MSVSKYSREKFWISLVVLLSTINLHAIEPTKQLLMDASRTYGYVSTQTLVTEKLKDKYPEMKQDLIKAQVEFDSKFKSSIENIKILFGKEWNNYEKMMQPKLIAYANKINLDLSYKNGFVNEILNRAKGNIESPIIETLLMFNSNYQKNPTKEFYDGFKKRLYSKDNQKAKGVDFHIDIPQSWKVKDGKRPNTLWLLTSQNGYLDEDDTQISFGVVVKELPEKIETLSQKDVQDFCEEAFKDNPAKECIKTTLENLPTIYARNTMKMERLRIKGTTEIANYFVFFNDRIIILQGMANTINNKLSQIQLNKKFDKYLPLFDQITNSLVIKNLYTKEQESEDEFYTYKLFNNKFQAVFPDTPTLKEFPREALNLKYIIESLPYEYKKELSKKQIEKIAMDTIEKVKNSQPYIYSDTINQVSYTSQNFPSGLEHKNYLYSGIKSQIDKIVKDALKVDNRTIIEFSSTFDKYNDKYIAIYTSYYYLDGQKVYSTSKHIFYKEQVYKWSVSYFDKKDKRIFDEYHHNVKILE